MMTIQENIANIQSEAAELAANKTAPVVQPAEPVTNNEPVDNNNDEQQLTEPVELEDTTAESGSETNNSGGFKKRVDKLNKKIAERDAEINHWKKIALENSAVVNKQVPVTTATTNKSVETRPSISDYADIGDYTDAVANWAVEQAFTKKEEANKSKQVVTSYQQKATEFLKTTPDFDDVLALAGEVPAAPEIHQIILESDIGPQLAYHLAKNPDEMDRINKLPPHRRLIEMGRLEDKLVVKPTANKPVVDPVGEKKVSAAPVPIKAEKGAAPVKKDINDPNLTQAEYRAIRAAQLGKRFR